jgi:endonuclease/exonuclease/phosphatase family metal-dependent hydrolase
LSACARPSRIDAPPAPATAQTVVAVATWNVHAGRGDLPRFLGDLASGALTGTPPHAYVALLQEDVETGANSAATLAARRGLASFFVPVRVDASRVSGNAILSTLPLGSPYGIGLLRERQPRAAAMVSITFAGETLFVVNVHMENRVTWWRGLFSDTARGRQAEALLETLPRDGHGILGGDLNTWLGPREPAWRAMAKRFRDTPTDPSQPTFRDRLVLDHLFFDLPDGWTAIRRVVGDSYGSDHHPVVALVTTATRTTKTN